MGSNRTGESFISLRHPTTSITVFTRSRPLCFGIITPLTSLSLTKLDGTAKGGIIFALAQQSQLPIRFIGIGGAQFNVTKVGDTTVNGTLTSTNSCSSGYTRAGLWCMDTDGTLSELRTSVTSNEASYTSTVVDSSAVLVIIRTGAFIGQDGTGDTATTRNCVIPGDSSVTDCAESTSQASSQAAAELANEDSLDINDTTVMTGSTGNVKTRCVISGTTTLQRCRWWVAGYMD